MDIFDVLTLIGGLSLFLFGMNIMGQALERRAGGQLCQLRAHDFKAGHQYHHGSQYWYDCYGLGLKPGGD